MPLPHFAHPAALPAVVLLLLLVPAIVWVWLRLGRGSVRFPSAVILLALPRGRSALARRAGAGLRAVALVLLIVALAGPRWPDEGTRIPAEGIAIGFVVDVSGSMAERDFTWKDQSTGVVTPVSRLGAVKKVFRLFVEGGEGPDGERLQGRDSDQVALVTFATRPESACPLTLSHSVLLQILDAERPRSLPTEAQTNVGDAIAWGLHRLKPAGNRRKVLILLSDGEHNVPPPALKPRQAAQLAGNLGVPIYVLDAGSDAPPGKPGPENTSAADRGEAKRTLQEVAKISGGRYFPVQDTSGLLEVAARIDELERQRVESFQYRRYHEGYAWFGLGSFVLLVTALGLELTVWRKVP